jgi:hypothetical protein
MKANSSLPRLITRRGLLSAAGVGGLALLSKPAWAQAIVDHPITGDLPAGGGFVNIADYGAVGDGVAPSGQAFYDFTQDYQGLGVSLYIPPGEYDLIDWPGERWLYGGISQLYVHGYGATLLGVRDENTAGAYFGTVGGVTSDFLLDRVRINQPEGSVVATAGAGAIANYSVGDWILVAALDLEDNSNQPNAYYYQYAQIIDITGDTITLQQALNYEDRFLTTYPDYTPEHVSTAGPASIFRLHPEWDADFTIAGMHFPIGTIQNVRRLKFIDCTFDVSPLPGFQREMICERCTIKDQVEVDKCIGSLSFYDCDVADIIFQSPSPDLCLIDNSRFEIIRGTPKNIVIRNTSVSSGITFGPRAIGRTESVTIEESHITSIDNWGTGYTAFPDIDDYTFSEGTFTLGGGQGPASWTVPGAPTFFFRPGAVERFYAPPFVVTDIRQSGANTFIDTTLPHPLPLSSDNPTAFYTHPCANINVTNSSGCDDMLELSKAPDGISLYSYMNRTYTGNVFNSGSAPKNLFGYIKSAIINVTRAYTGAEPTLTLDLTGRYVDVALDSHTFSETVNLKVAGRRILTPGSVVGTQSGDTLVAPTIGDWFIGNVGVKYSKDIRGDKEAEWPIVIIEVVLDQIAAPSNVSTPGVGTTHTSLPSISGTRRRRP